MERLAPRAPREVLGDSRLERLGTSANPATSSLAPLSVHPPPKIGGTSQCHLYLLGQGPRSRRAACLKDHKISKLTFVLRRSQRSFRLVASGAVTGAAERASYGAALNSGAPAPARRLNLRRRTALANSQMVVAARPPGAPDTRCGLRPPAQTRLAARRLSGVKTSPPCARHRERLTVVPSRTQLDSNMPNKSVLFLAQMLYSTSAVSLKYFLSFG